MAEIKLKTALQAYRTYTLGSMEVHTLGSIELPTGSIPNFIWDYYYAYQLHHEN